MDQHAPFLAEICEHPEDDAPRLIYADWLEEQGDSRAAGIRLQCEAAKLPGWHPRRNELELHAKLAGLPECELPQLHETNWSDPERGFVYDAAVSNWGEFEDAADLVFRRAPIYSLWIPANREFLQRALDAPCLRRISDLMIDASLEPPVRQARPQVGEALTAFLASPMLARVKALCLAGLHESPRDAISQVASRLEEFDLLDVLLVFPADVEELCMALEPAPLRSLCLLQNRLGDGVVQLAQESLLGLETLWIRQNNVSRLGAQALVNSPRLEALRSLDLNGNRIGVPGLAALTDGFAQLEHLNLSENALGSHAVHELALARGLNSLQSLNLEHNSFGPEAFHPFRTSRALPELRHLDLSQNNLDERGVAALLATPLVERLESLDLSSNPVGDDGARMLAASPAVAGLKWFNLSNAGLTSAGAAMLARSPHLEGLRCLNLRDNAIDKAVPDLKARFPCARELMFAMPYAT